MKERYNILFLCTGNSARSIMAEAVANHIGHGRLRAFSAGSQPSGQVQPLALEALRDAGIPTDGLRSKSWDEFGTVDAPPMDIVITVCGNAAGEACPVWPGHPVTAHWGVDDPVAVPGDEAQRRKAFGEAMLLLRQRISLLLSLQPQALERLALQQRLHEIGQQG
ncbi:arsenate reductase ArsC [Thermomonas brevis]